MTPQFVLIALGTFVSEDLTCIATGVLVSQHQLGLIEGTLACLLGIFVGDTGLYMLGRLAGETTVVKRWIPEDKLATAASWIDRQGLKVVIISRFTPGLRLPTYVAAGLLRSRFWGFVGYFLLAAFVWTPLLVAGTAAFGEQALHNVLSQDRPVYAALLGAFLFGLIKLRCYEIRRCCVGFLKRLVQWEFWPAWAAYAPLVPYLLFLAFKHRSTGVFTACNPGMFAGGLVGESKSEILSQLDTVPGVVAPFQVVPMGDSHITDTFPVVAKPDQGERGKSVAIIRSQSQLNAYLKQARSRTIIQRFVPGEEFGIYYVRHPEQRNGKVPYITVKRAATVVGDGYRNLRQLILDDSRAVCMAQAYLGSPLRPLQNVPGAGETVALGEIGAHSRGAIFLDGSRLVTPALEHAIDRVSHAHPGFYLGRYDVLAASFAALQRGEFTVIELNGVSAEATHVYDPSVSIRETYRVMALHWRNAFEFGALNQQHGARAFRFVELVRLLMRSSERAS